MVCGVTLFIKNLSESEQKFIHSKYNFSATFGIENGDELGFNNFDVDTNRTIWRVATYRYLKLFIGYKENPLTKKIIWYLKIRGSIHKYALGNNVGRFSPSDAVKALAVLCEELNIKPNRVIVNRLEVGINIPLTFTASEYISICLLRMGKYPFIPMISNSRDKIIGKEVKLSHHTVKVYSKDEKLIRVEIHWNDLQELREKDFRIYTLADLTDVKLSRISSEKLLPKIGKLTSLDGILLEKKYLPTELGKSDELILLRYSSNTYANHIDHLLKMFHETGKHKEYERVRRKHLRHRKRFDELIKKFGRGLDAEIFKKAHDLINGQCPKIELGIKSKIGT